MIHSVSIENFKCMGQLNMENLPQIALISARNNVGKSTLLEAIYFINAYQVSNVLTRVRYIRQTTSADATPEDLWEHLFKNRDVSNPIRISIRDDVDVLDMEVNQLENIPEQMLENSEDVYYVGQEEDGFEKVENRIYPALQIVVRYDAGSLQSIFSIDGHGNLKRRNILSGNREMRPYVQYINTRSLLSDKSLVKFFSDAELKGKKDFLIESLRIMQNDLKDIFVISHGETSELYATLEDETKIPVKLMGDGVNKLITILLAILQREGATILIDEIENGFHYSIYAKVWEIISNLAIQMDVQLIATSHSYDCIQGAYESVLKLELQEKFKYIRLHKAGDVIQPKNFTTEMLGLALQDEMEIR